MAKSMKYNSETTKVLLELYNQGQSVELIAKTLEVPERSVIAKLSSLGVYRKKQYVNKNGEMPIKKGWYIERLAALLDQNIELLESLEKVNKRVLQLLVKALEPDPKL